MFHIGFIMNIKESIPSIYKDDLNHLVLFKFWGLL